MQSVSSRIWTRVAVSISYNDNHYTTGTIQFRHTAEEFHVLLLNINYSIQRYSFVYTELNDAKYY